MLPSRGPTVVRVHSSNNGGGGGIKCCCFKCCTCINLQILRTEPGMLKIVEIVKFDKNCEVGCICLLINCISLQIIGSFCQSLALNYGLHYASTMGAAYQSFLTTSCWCFMTTLLLLCNYVLSEKSVILVRQSFFVCSCIHLKCSVCSNLFLISGDPL